MLENFEAILKSEIARESARFHLASAIAEIEKARVLVHGSHRQPDLDQNERAGDGATARAVARARAGMDEAEDEGAT
jgi:hypothetical protein